MSRTATTAREDFTFNPEIVVDDVRSSADTPIRWGTSTTTSGSLVDYARELVRRADVAAREMLAKEFAEKAHLLAGVREVRLTAVEHEDFVVTVLTETRDLELDLALQRLFIACAESFGGRWSLRTRPYGHDDPEQDGDLI